MSNMFDIKLFIETQYSHRADQLRNRDYVFTIYGDYIFYVPGQSYPLIKGNKCIGVAEVHNISLDLSPKGNKSTVIQFALKKIPSEQADGLTKLWRSMQNGNTSSGEDTVIPGAIQFSNKEKIKRDRPDFDKNRGRYNDHARRQQEAASRVDTSIFRDFFDD